jgi:hypothetical protein
MPQLYEYFGLMVFFYANEHEPVHVHGRRQGREARAEIEITAGSVTGLTFTRSAGRPALTPPEQRRFEELVTARADDIVGKWIDYFVLNKSISPERITTRLK